MRKLLNVGFMIGALFGAVAGFIEFQVNSVIDGCEWAYSRLSRFWKGE